MFSSKKQGAYMSVTNFPVSRRRNCVLLAGFVLFLPFCAFVSFTAPDLSSEHILLDRLAELQIKLQYLNSIYRSRQDDFLQITQQIDILLHTENISTSQPTSPYTSFAQHELKHLRNSTVASGLNPSVTIRLPSSHHFLPHLLDDQNSLKLRYLLSKGRTGVSVVLGIPTVKRERQSYLLDTLQNLVDGMTNKEAGDVVIVVFVAEIDLDYVLQVAKEVESRFSTHLESGLIEIIAPNPSYYPNLNKLRQTLGDSPERVRWRSKQNLDFAYLMSYAQPKGMFYVQLEDDILAKPRYISEMLKFAMDKTARKEAWIVLDFCQLGFIGKLFKSAELPWLIQFFQMFFNDKPVDWLLDHMISTKVCNWEKNQDSCKREKAKMWIHYKPSLFQHIGMHSSLKGKVQKLKDKQFGKIVLFFPHVNPEATVSSDIKHYKQFSLDRAYLGETFFWGLLPQQGDKLTFAFSNPVAVKRYLFKSGNPEHPSDKFYNTTIEVLPLAHYNQSMNGNHNVTTDGFRIVGKFDNAGIAEGTIDDSLKPLQALRLHVRSDSNNWAILSEILIQDDAGKT